jgi:YD repeat-containing protein
MIYSRLINYSKVVGVQVEQRGWQIRYYWDGSVGNDALVEGTDAGGNSDE